VPRRLPLPLHFHIADVRNRRGDDAKKSVTLIWFRIGAGRGGPILIFFVQSLLQFFPGLVVEFFVFARWPASLLPEFVGPPDNIHFFRCGGHVASLRLMVSSASSMFRVSDLLARIHVDQHVHHWILFDTAMRSGPSLWDEYALGALTSGALGAANRKPM